MSLILDALKKLEQERAGRQSRTVGIRPAITGGRPRSATPKRRRVLLFAAGMVMIIAVTVAVTARFSRPGRSSFPPPAAPLQETSPRATETQWPATTSSPVPPSPAVQAAPVPAAPERSQQLSLPAAGQREQAAARPESRPAPVDVPATAVNDIKVTGIAWQDERGGRRAVVNGILAPEGGVIAGAKIVEIHQDRVSFVRGGIPFVITINSSFPAK